MERCGGGHPGEKLWKYVLAMTEMGDRTIYDDQQNGGPQVRTQRRVDHEFGAGQNCITM